MWLQEYTNSYIIPAESHYKFSDEFQLEIDQNPTLGMKDKDILYQQIPLKD